MEKKFRKILVTGGLGLIGAHIVNRLAFEGYRVIVLDNRNMTEFSLGKRPDGVEFLQGDITNLKDVRFAMEGVDAVFHCAAIARTMETLQKPLRAHAVNATGTLFLLQIAQQCGVKRFVYSSSSILKAPGTPYFVGKQCSEGYCDVFDRLYGLSTISLRYANVYGPGQRQDGGYPNVMAAFAKRIKEKGEILVDGSGEQNRSFIHVDDVVEANMLALNSDLKGAYEIATDEYTSINTIADWFEHETTCVVKYGPERKGDIFTIRLDTEKAEKELGFRAKIPFTSNSIRSYL